MSEILRALLPLEQQDNLSKIKAVRFTKEEAQVLEKRAQERGCTFLTYIRVLIAKGLRVEGQPNQFKP